MQALQEFGAPLSAVGQEDFTKPEVVFQIGVSPRRIDIMTSIDSVEFDAAWGDRMDVKMEGVVVPVLSREHFIQNKRALGRAQDRADIERLEESEKQ